MKVAVKEEKDVCEQVVHACTVVPWYKEWQSRIELQCMSWLEWWCLVEEKVGGIYFYHFFVIGLVCLACMYQRACCDRKGWMYSDVSRSKRKRMPSDGEAICLYMAKSTWVDLHRCGKKANGGLMSMAKRILHVRTCG